jgi:hypothetical protein
VSSPTPNDSPVANFIFEPASEGMNVANKYSLSHDIKLE